MEHLPRRKCQIYKFIRVSKTGRRDTYLVTKVIWETKALLFTHALETATAAMHRTLSQEKDDGQDKPCEKTKNDECTETDQGEKLVRLVLDVGDDFQIAELAALLHWSI